MPSLAAAKASNEQYAPSYIPTAVFVGGTSGIGYAMAEIYAKQTKGRANIIIVGRNKEAAVRLLSTFPSAPTTGVDGDSDGKAIRHEFVSCDATSLQNVERTCKVLASKLEKINILGISIGGIPISQEDTVKGNGFRVEAHTGGGRNLKSLAFSSVLTRSIEKWLS
jgi:NAD(P)-dependent dehydrogenase (short-subunit alcohol dehydrogenase family)